MNLLLPQASSNAGEVDALLLALIVISAAVLVLVFGLMGIFIWRYHGGSRIDRGAVDDRSWRIEVSWTAATLVAFFGLFIWGADLYLRQFQVPPDALKIYVVGKQWMWKVEHDGGQREINALHVPVNRPVELVMTSEDVIHDFAIPAFRIKHDVLPDRYETLWFRADRPGRYHLFCTQFCGVDHAVMGGEVVVMPGADYERWLASNGGAGTMAESGAALFRRSGCDGCHGGGSTVRAPSLAGLFGASVPLADGSVVRADDGYLHDAIVQPGRLRVAGYAPVMPSFAGVLGEDEVLRLVAYLKSLAGDRS